MRFSLLFCCVVFGPALAVVGCERNVETYSAPVGAIGAITIQPIKAVLPVIAGVKQPAPKRFVDDSCYVVPGCPEIIAGWEKDNNR